jgi:putative ABC transport system permease protein
MPTNVFARNFDTLSADFRYAIRGLLREPGFALTALIAIALVAAQIAVSLVLITAASLLLQSFRNVEAVPLGLASEHLITATISLGHANYPAVAQRFAFFEELESRMQGMPGADAFAISDTIPPSGAMRGEPCNALEIAGEPRHSEEAGGMVGWRDVTPGYFPAFRIPILWGRGFEETDRTSSDEVVVLSQALAHRLFGDRDALGARIRFHPDTPFATVIGVAANFKNGGVLEPDDPEYYVVRKRAGASPAGPQTPPDFGWRASVIVRSSLPPATIANWIRQRVAAIDSTLPLTIETMDQRVGKLEARPRFNAWLLTLFAAIGVLLSAIGLYGMVSFLVVQRTQEIGVRMALGATPGNIARLVLARASRWAAAGVLLGVAGSLAAGRAMESVLYGVSGRDARILATCVAMMLMIALLAAWIPSQRAARGDPVGALRRE